MRCTRMTSNKLGAHSVAGSVAACLLLGMVMLLSGCEKLWLDRQMEELCARDGGVKVYETVTLPPEMFDQYGDPFPGWRKRKTEDRFGPDYRYEVINQVLNDGDPLEGGGRLERTEWRILRLTDQKLMGFAVAYIRVGGDFIVIGHPSGTHCPKVRNEHELIHSVFLREE